MNLSLVLHNKNSTLKIQLTNKKLKIFKLRKERYNSRAITLAQKKHLKNMT